ncbi:MAG: HAMP domain-containing protein [Zoogloea sp.]|nr:HAMP domain-containing protein [Zoogloea sp.]
MSRPIQEAERLANTIRLGIFRRMAYQNDDEVGRLAVALNEMVRGCSCRRTLPTGSPRATLTSRSSWLRSDRRLALPCNAWWTI